MTELIYSVCNQEVFFPSCCDLKAAVPSEFYSSRILKVCYLTYICPFRSPWDPPPGRIQCPLPSKMLASANHIHYLTLLGRIYFPVTDTSFKGSVHFKLRENEICPRLLPPTSDSATKRNDEIYVSRLLILASGAPTAATGQPELSVSSSDGD